MIVMPVVLIILTVPIVLITVRMLCSRHGATNTWVPPSVLQEASVYLKRIAKYFGPFLSNSAQNP